MSGSPLIPGPHFSGGGLIVKFFLFGVLLRSKVAFLVENKTNHDLSIYANSLH